MTTFATPPTTSADRWPDVTAVPHAPLRARVARAIVGRAPGRTGVAIQQAGAAPLRAGVGPAMVIHSPQFFDRLGAHLGVGLAESYLAGEWDAADGTDLGDLLTAFAEHLPHLVPGPLRRFRRLVERHRPAHERNSIDGARTNISRHYDLSNELFACFLDDTMSYSAAWFARTEDDLAAAQRAKIDRLLDVAGVGAGTRLLEIGTGWGQLAIQAAGRGATVQSITLSEEQCRLARRRVEAAGLTDRVRIEVCDYRHVAGEYDAAVSVEMIEAVGESYLPDYFDAVARALVPGGRFGLQAITMPHERMLETRHAHTWVHKYVFPGGFIPSREQIDEHAGRAGLEPSGSPLSLRVDYARTLREWRERFTAADDQVDALGFDATFRRLWELYLAYSEAGFRAAQLDDWQLGFTRR